MKIENENLAGFLLLSIPIWIFDIDRSRIVWGNDAAMRTWHAHSLDELCSRDLSIEMSVTIKKRLKQFQTDFISSGTEFHEQWSIYPQNRPVSFKMRLTGYILPDGRMGALFEAKELVKDAPESLRSVEALMHTGVMISLYKNDGTVLYRNPAARESVTFYDMPLGERIIDDGELNELIKHISRKGEAKQVLEVLTSTGVRWHEISARRCKDVVTGNDAILLSEVDVSQIKYAQAHSIHIANHDSLTGLPNRSYIFQSFIDYANAREDKSQSAAVIFIDLDNFKDINDTLGHLAGDSLLVEVAHRLTGIVRSTDIVARLGGDEFLILMSGNSIVDEVESLKARLGKTIECPIRIEDKEVRVTASAGVAIFPRHGKDINSLMRNADLAMYSSKAKGRNTFSFYEESMSEAVQRRLDLERDLRRAIELNEFVVYFQPRVCVFSNKIMGAEALVRWKHPSLGILGPDVFIDVCEKLDLIHKLGEFVLIAAAEQQRIWASQGYNLVVSINLSPKQVFGIDFLDVVKNIVERIHCRPEYLEFEITESILLGKSQVNKEIISGLRKMGFTIAIDDFGTGYSNLAYLSQFEVNALKIDKSFIQGIDINKPVAELIVSLCKLMKLTIVAEGVEDCAQLEWAKQHHIDQYQGYLFSKAIDISAFSNLLVLHNGLENIN